MKKILALILALIFIIAVTSCANSSTSSSPSSNNTSSVSSGHPNSSNVSVAPPHSSGTQSFPSTNPSTDSSNESGSSDFPTSSGDFSENSSYDSSNESENTSSFSPIGTIKPIKPENKWCYTHLTQIQKQIYTELYDLVVEYSIEFVEFEDCEYDDLVLADYALRCDYPELFWIGGSFYTIYNETEDKYSIGYYDEDLDDSGHLCSFEESKLLAEALDEAVAEFMENINPQMTEYEIVLAAHDFIADRVTYDDEAAADHEANPFSFTSYGALVSGKAVCEGYAKAFQLLMNKIGIYSICVTGSYDGVGHMWNMVKIGGDWYNVDITFDDQSSLYHLYLNKTDEFMLHNKYTIDPDFQGSVQGEGYNIAKPDATAELMSYHNVTGYVIDSDIPINNGFYNAVKLACKNEKTSIEVMLDPSIDANTFNIQNYIRNVDLSTLDITSLDIISFSGVTRVFIISWGK